MRRDPPTTSLLSYLDAEEAKFKVEITRISSQAPGVETAQLPFLRVSDSGPTTCITAAKVITDAGSVLRRVFFLQQKDEYRLHADEIWPINNADIDQLWQEAVARYSNQPAEKARIEFHLQQIAECIGFDRFTLPVLSRKTLFGLYESEKDPYQVIRFVGNHLGHDVSGTRFRVVPQQPQGCAGGG